MRNHNNKHFDCWLGGLGCKCVYIIKYSVYAIIEKEAIIESKSQLMGSVGGLCARIFNSSLCARVD